MANWSNASKTIQGAGHVGKSATLAAGGPGLERFVAYFIVLASTIPIGTSQYLRLALALLVPRIPVMISRWLRSKREVTLTLLVLSSAFSGLMLATQNMGSGRSWDSWAASSQTAQALVLVLAVSGAFWCSSIIGYNKFLLVWCSDTAICAPLAADRFADNPWKFGLALPISLIVLYIASRFSSRAVPLAFLGLMTLSVAMSFRSWILVLGAAFLVYLFAVRSGALPVPVLAVLFIGVAWDMLFSPNNSWTLAVAIALGFQVLATAALQDLAGASDYRAVRAHLA